MKDYLSIKEFSDLTGIESSTLRYWDDIGLFPPAKRDECNGYRYYTPEQIIQVNFITVLSNLEIPLKTITQVQQDRTPESILDLIEDQERVLDAKARQLRERISVLNIRRWIIKNGLMSKKVTDDVMLMNLERMNFVRGRHNNFKDGENFYRPFVEFCKSAKELRINLRFPIAGMHNDWQEYSKAPGSPPYWISLDPDGNECIENGEYVIGLVKGYYGDSGGIQEKMAKFIKDNNIKVQGPVYSIYLHDEVCVRDSDKYLAMTAVAVVDE